MASVDMYNNVFVVQSLTDQTYNATTPGAVIDLQGYEAVTIIFSTGIVDAGVTYRLLVEDADLPAGPFADASSKVLGRHVGLDITNANNNSIYRLGYVGSSQVPGVPNPGPRRYLRLTLVRQVGAGNIRCQAKAVLGAPRSAQTPPQLPQV